MTTIGLATAQQYLDSFKAQATSLYEQAKQYVSYQEPDADKPYQMNFGDRVVDLTGDAKTLAIRHTALVNREVQFQRINKAATAVIGLAVYHYGVWNHNPLWYMVVIPVALGYNKVNELISQHFKNEKDVLALAIQEAAQKKV